MKWNIVTVVLMCCWIGNIVQAQQNGAYGAKAPPKIELDGKLQAWQGGMMRILNSAGQPISFSLPKSPSGIRFIAPVEQGVLRKGMVIRIQAPVGANGKFLEPINFLTLFTPDRSKMNTPLDRSMNVPGVYRVNQVQRPAPGELGSPDVRIVGTIVGIEPNLLALQCGNTMMKLELSDSPKIELNSSSLEFAKAGDSVRGSAVINIATNQLSASSIMIRASKPLKAPTQPAVAASESVKLRVKEKPKPSPVATEVSESSATSEKSEMKDSPEASNKTESSSKPEAADQPESNGKPESTEGTGLSLESPESSTAPESKEDR